MINNKKQFFIFFLFYSSFLFTMQREFSPLVCGIPMTFTVMAKLLNSDIKYSLFEYPFTDPNLETGSFADYSTYLFKGKFSSNKVLTCMHIFFLFANVWAYSTNNNPSQSFMSTYSFFAAMFHITSLLTMPKKQEEIILKREKD